MESPTWRRMKRWTMGSLAARFLTADDIFVSYARVDGSNYAVALASRLAQSGFICRLDQWGSEPGRGVPQSILNAVRHSQLFVLVCTRGALASTAIRDELMAFIPTHRPIVIVDVGARPTEALWGELIGGLPISEEAEAQPLVVGDPIVGRIENSCRFMRRTQKLKRAALAMSLTLLGLVISAATLGVVIARQRTEASRLSAENEQQRHTNESLARSNRDLEARNASLASEKASAEAAARLQEELASLAKIASDSTTQALQLYWSTTPQRPFELSIRGGEPVRRLGIVSVPFGKYDVSVDKNNFIEGVEYFAGRGFRVGLEAALGRFCVRYLGGQPFLAPEDTPTERCEWYPRNTEEALVLGERVSVQLRSLVSDAQLTSAVTYAVWERELPPPSYKATAGELNAEAQRANRIRITLDERK